MRLKQNMDDRRRHRVMVSELYDRRGERLAWALVALAAVAALLLAVTASAEGTLTVTLNSGTLNVRSKPGGTVIAELFDGDKVTLVSEKNGWAHVLCPCEAGEGYVKSEYLTDDTDHLGEYINCTGGRVKVRDMPGGKLIRWLKRGKSVTVTAWRGAWAWIGDGWVAADCLEAQKEP